LIWIGHKIIGFDIPTFEKGTLILLKIGILILLGLVLYLNNNYFLKNRERRNSFIDGLRDLKESYRFFWNVIGVATMCIPIWFLIFLIIQRKLQQ